MYTRLMRTVIATAACVVLFASTADADFQISKRGKSGQLYSWSAGHC